MKVYPFTLCKTTNQSVQYQHTVWSWFTMWWFSKLASWSAETLHTDHTAQSDLGLHCHSGFVGLGLIAVWITIPVYSLPVPREREKEKRSKRWEKKYPNNPHQRLLQHIIIQISRMPQNWKLSDLQVWPWPSTYLNKCFKWTIVPNSFGIHAYMLTAWTSWIYDHHFTIWPSSVTLTSNLPDQMFQINNCARFFWNPCIKVEVMARTGSIYDHFNTWPSSVTLTFNLPDQMFQMNNCVKLFWNPCINVEVIAQTSCIIWPSSVTLTFNLPE